MERIGFLREVVAGKIGRLRPVNEVEKRGCENKVETSKGK